MGTTDKEHGIVSTKKSKTKSKKKSSGTSKLRQWINSQLEAKGLSASAAKKDAGKYKTISAAKKAGSLYYTNPKGVIMIAAFASDLDKMPKKSKPKKSKNTAKQALEDYDKYAMRRSAEEAIKKSKEVGKSVNITDEQRRSRNKGKVDSTASVTVVSDRKGFDPIGGVLKSIKSGPEQVIEKNRREAAALKKINALQKKILQKLDAKDIERFLRIKNGAGSNVGKFNQLKTFERKVKDMNVGGLTQSAMQNGLNRKINPTTGLTMNKGGMMDYRKKGMFYGGGMTRRGR